MAYRGLKKEEDVAAMLLYLRSLSGDPKPLPEAPAQ
jgi:cytochrome c2